MRYSQRILIPAALVFGMLFWEEAAAQFIQQGQKLVGAGATGPLGAKQGCSVSLSADGNTAIVGGPNDDYNGDSTDRYVGAVWVFTRSASVWSQQGEKLVGTGAVGGAALGRSVSLSADGNTALVSGGGDSSSAGAAWVFTRSGGVWSQQGGKLVGTGALGNAWQGSSVALSADGNTAIVGGPNDGSNVGAAWVFTRNGGVWSQQRKLVGTGAVGGAGQGYSVSLSADGNTAIVGGVRDSNSAGAAWVFTRSSGVWSQQGPKLVGAGATGPGAAQGWSVSLSGDGNTAIVGGVGDGRNIIGAVWVFTRSGGIWSQQGNKLVGTYVGTIVYQGYSVSLSSDGNTAIVGGPYDYNMGGAAWVFTRSGGVWSQLGKLVGTGAVGAQSAQGWSVSLSGDGNTAIVGGPHDNVFGVGAAWVFARNAADVAEQATRMPLRFALGQNYPNPFNPCTTIKYELPKSSMVRLSVYDILGREVSVLVNDRREGSVHEVKFDGSNLGSGVYFYRLQAGDYVVTKRLLLLK